MKRLFMVSAIICGIYYSHAQEMYLKKETVKMDENWELYSHYNYDDNMKLVSKFQLNYNGDTAISIFYDNERIQMEIQPNLTMQFEFQGDSVLEYREQNDGSFLLSTVFFLNGAYEMVEYKIVDNDGNYVGSTSYDWEFGNCVGSVNSIGGEEFMEYDLFARNPYYNENKFFRRSFHGSLNQMTAGYFLSVDYAMSIISVQNEYPTEIEFSDSNGNERTIYYEYFDPAAVGDISYLPHQEVLDVLYFNALGQQIDQPARGFYIEKVITPRGSYTKKYFKGCEPGSQP